MADLHHLLDELDRPQQEEEDTAEGNNHPNDPIVDDNNINNNDDEDEYNNNNDTMNDDNDAPSASIPLALREAFNNKHDEAEAAAAGTVSPNKIMRLDLSNFDQVDADGNDVAAEGASSQQQIAYKQLKTWWMQEVGAPELLPFNQELMDSWIQHLNDDEEKDDEQEDTMNGALGAVLSSIRRVDRQRVQFIISNLLSTRLHKLQKYHLHYNNQQTQQQQQSQQQQPFLLSDAERTFVQDYSALWQKHMEETTTRHFPQSVWKALDEDDMIPRPNTNEFCWVRVVGTNGVSLKHSQSQPSQSQQSQNEYDEYDDDEEADRYDQGSTLILPYHAAKPLMEQGQVELYF